MKGENVMKKIKCPQCGNEIELGTDEYESILNDISKEEVDRQVKLQLESKEEALKAKYNLEVNKAKAAQDKTIGDLNTQIEVLRTKLNNSSKETELEVNKAKSEQEKTINSLKNQINVLNEQLKNNDNATKLAVKEAVEATKKEVSEKEKEIVKLQGDLTNVQSQNQLTIEELKKNYKFQLDTKDEEIEKYKNMRLGGSTKDIGESLEQYCQNEFNRVRMLSFPNAQFAKDNISDEFGKGDYIFRDFIDGEEYISIMFEMKNEAEETKKKQKNSEFYKKLNNNRNSKHCEYAVLVTTLEEDNNLFNDGIVDLSYEYPKMYAIRPQYFIALIGILKNMAKDNYANKRQIVEYKQQNIDITTFEEAVRIIGQKINDDYDKAFKKYDEVEKYCDTVIKAMNDLKEAHRIAMGHIGTARNRLPELEVRKLTKNNPTMKAKFEELHSGEVNKNEK